MTKYYFYFISLFELIYSLDVEVNIHPDSITVGSLVNLAITITNLGIDEIPVFQDIIPKNDSYSIVNKTLSSNSAVYTLQFWEAGLEVIPQITIEIMKQKQYLKSIVTNEIRLEILSVISSSGGELRNIKPMKNIKITNIYQNIFFIVLIMAGFCSGWYFWSERFKNLTTEFKPTTYKKSAFQNSIDKIQELPLPRKINSQSTEEYYLALSHIFRTFIRDKYFIKATEMTTEELEKYFNSKGFNEKLIRSWIQLSHIVDMAKYAKIIPELDKFSENKKDFIQLIKSFHNVEDNKKFRG